MKARLEVHVYGDAGVLVGVQADDYESRWATTQALATAIRAARPAWLIDVVATYDHLFVAFDPETAHHHEVESLLQALTGTLNEPSDEGQGLGGRTFRVPVLFGGDAGPDLDTVAAELAMSADALIDRLTTAPWRVRFVASPVGTPFTG